MATAASLVDARTPSTGVAAITDTRPVVAYCGFTDSQNVGDFALFRANELLFPSLRLVDSGDSGAQANLFGGGTMFPYSLRYGTFPRRSRNVGIGVGVLDPSLHGAFGPLTRLALHRWRFQWLGVRGPRSQAILAQHGIRSEVTGDTALLHGRPDGVGVTPGLVALNIIGEDMKRLGSNTTTFDAALEAGKRLRSAGKRVLLVPFCTTDRPIMQRLEEALSPDVEVLDFWGAEVKTDLDRFLRELARCELMVGERLHSLVLAAALDMPFVGLAYKPKSFDFVESLGLSRLLVEPESISGQHVTAMALDVLAEAGAITDEIRTRVAALRVRLTLGAEEALPALTG